MAASDQLSNLRARAKEAEDRVAAAQGKAKADLEQDVKRPAFGWRGRRFMEVLLRHRPPSISRKGAAFRPKQRSLLRRPGSFEGLVPIPEDLTP
jgi:hypothetical protein